MTAKSLLFIPGRRRSLLRRVDLQGGVAPREAPAGEGARPLVRNEVEMRGEKHFHPYKTKPTGRRQAPQRNVRRGGMMRPPATLGLGKNAASSEANAALSRAVGRPAAMPAAPLPGHRLPRPL